MSQATPRKFSEKIAILERKQNEEQEQFNNVMRDIRTITSTDQPQQQSAPHPQPSPIQQHYTAPTSNDSSCGSKLSPEGPHPLTANWNRAGGSLPNVHQMVQQPLGSSNNGGAAYVGCWTPSWTNMSPATSASGQGQQIQQQHVRTRSPGAPHFHPYRNGCGAGVMPAGGGLRHEQQRMSQGETSSRGGALVGVHLRPPDPTWSKARSDPAIHTASMMTTMDPSGFMSAYPYGGQNSVGQCPSTDAKMFNGPATAPTSAVIMPPTMPMAFFPNYPAGLSQQSQPLSPLHQMLQSPSTLPPNSQQPQQQHQSASQQAFSPPQQLGSPSSSSSVQNQQNFMGRSEMIGMGTAGPMNLQNNNQQGRPNAGMAAAANFTNYQQQQMMSNCMQNNMVDGTLICKTTYQSPQQNFANTTMGYHQFTPPMYPTGPNGLMKMSGAIPSLQQQQTQNIMMNQSNSGNDGTLQHNGGNIHHLHQQQLTTPSMPGQSQSAPTSPSSTSATQCPSQMDGNNQGQHPLSIVNVRQQQLQQQWAQPLNRNFSASPDGMEVPNICVTGTDGSLDVDCFQDLQDLHLDSETLQMLKDPTANEQVDPACETQLLS